MAHPTIASQLHQSVQVLAKLSESELEEELGRRLTMTDQEFATQTALTTSAPIDRTTDAAGVMGPLDFLHRLAKSFLKRMNHSLYSLVCDDTDPDNKKVTEAAAKGTEALGYAIAGALAVSFGMLPAIAGVVGTILAKRIVKSGHGALCDVWKEQL